MVGGVVGQGQPLHIQKSVENTADGDGQNSGQDVLRAHSLPGEKGAEQLIEKQKGENVHDDAGQHHGNGKIGGFPVFSRVVQYLLKQNKYLLLD